MACVILLIHVGIQQFIQKKAGWFGLTLKSLFMWSHTNDHGIQSSDVHSCINYTGERWMETATIVLYKLKLILGVYCVGIRWFFAHLVHIFVCFSCSFLVVAVWWKSYPSKCFFPFTTAGSGNILKFTSRWDFLWKPSVFWQTQYMWHPELNFVAKQDRSFQNPQKWYCPGKTGRMGSLTKTHVIKVLDMKFHKNWFTGSQ